MIRREAEMNLIEEKRSNGHTHTEDMELDEAATWEQMDTEDSGDGQVNADDLTLETLAYGQSLRAEFADDPRREVSKALNEIFALMAYQNPLKEKEVAHLLDRKGRVTVAEELNSAILRKSITYPLELPILTACRISWQVVPSRSGESIFSNERSSRRSQTRWRPRRLCHSPEHH